MTGRTPPRRLSESTRRRVICIGGAAGMMALTGRSARAALCHPVLRRFLPVRIALPDFVAGSPADAATAETIPRIIASNLELSRQFTPIDQAAFVDRTIYFELSPRFAEWRSIDAHALVTGRVIRQPDDRIAVAFRLWDVLGGRQLIRQRYLTAPDDTHRIAGIISYGIYDDVIGRKRNCD